MAHPRILHMITPLKHMSPFDVNMALDAGYDAAIPYTNVTIEDVTGLVQDAIFSRGPEGVKKTGMFIGGKRAIEALDMMKPRQGGDGAALRDLRVRRSGRLLHHRSGHGRLRRDGAEETILDRSQGQAHGRLRRHRRRRASPPP